MTSMNAERYLLVAVALCCVLAAGVAASTLDSSLETDPAEAVELDYSLLPIGEDTVEAAQEEAQGGDGSGAPGDDGGRTTKQGAADQGAPAGVDSADQGDGDAGESGSVDEGGPKMGQGPGSGVGGNQRGLVFTLLDLLEMLLPWLVLLALLALASHYRDRLRAVAAALWTWVGERSPTDRDRDRRWPRTVPDEAIHRAWLRMVSLTDLDRPSRRTTAEAERAAISQGLEAESVRALTDRFREVRYADEPATRERVDEVEEHLHRIERGERR